MAPALSVANAVERWRRWGLFAFWRHRLLVGVWRTGTGLCQKLLSGCDGEVFRVLAALRNDRAHGGRGRPPTADGDEAVAKALELP